MAESLSWQDFIASARDSADDATAGMITGNGDGPPLTRLPTPLTHVPPPLRGHVTAVDDIYPLASTLSPHLHNALKICGECLALLDEALAKIKSDPVGADISLQHLHGRVNELFCCRRLSDGFAMLVASICNALDAAATMVLDDAKLRALRCAFSTIRERPFLGTESALDQIDSLEEAGFEVESLVAGLFLDARDDAG